MLTWMDISNGRSDSGRVRCGSGGRLMYFKWEDSLMKHHMARNVDMVGWEVHANVPFLKGVVAKKKTLCKPILKFMVIVGLNIWETEAPKYFG